MSAAPPWRAGVPVTALVTALLLVDLGFVAANALHVLERLEVIGGPAWVADPRWALEVDQGFAEWAVYLQLSWAAGVLVVLATTGRAAVLAAWAVTLVAIVFDDALQVHERASVPLVEMFGLPAVLGLRGKDLGELLVWVAFGVVLLPLLAVGHQRSGPWARAVSWRLGLLLCALVALGAGGDLIHAVYDEGPIREVLVVVEDGGELAVATGMLLVAVVAGRSSGRAAVRAATPGRR